MTDVLRQYCRYLERNLRFGWTIDKDRELDLHNMQFRLRIASREGAKFSEETGEETCLGQPIIDATDLLERLGTVQRVMVLGAAGAGKSTFLRSIAYRLAKAVDTQSYVPVFVLAHDLLHLSNLSIPLLLEWIEQSSGVVGLASQVDHLLGVGRVLLLIDGIDELDRKSVSTVSQVLRRFASAYPDSRLMMSCRTFGYEEFARSESDLLTWVCPLVDEQIHDFLKSWYHDDVSVKSLFRVIQENRSVRTLARNPLFLTMLVTIWGHDKHIPVSVYSLYERAVELLLGDWDRIRGVFRENQYKSSLKKDLLTTLAVRHAKAIEPSMSLQRTFAALTHEGIHIASTLVEFGSIIEEIEKHSGLIQRVTRDHWRFSHSSFAEFFCARAVVDRPPGEIAEDIRDSRDVHAWIPILALAASALDQDVATKRIGTILAQAMWKTEADRIRSIAARDREIFRGTRGSASKSTERS